jgi:hypothetical protein
MFIIFLTWWFENFAKAIHDEIVKSPRNVIPAKAGIHNVLILLDAGFHRHDKNR